MFTRTPCVGRWARRGLHSTKFYYKMLTGEELEQARAEGKQLHLSHFAMCPNARRHRKKEAQQAK